MEASPTQLPFGVMEWHRDVPNLQITKKLWPILQCCHFQQLWRSCPQLVFSAAEDGDFEGTKGKKLIQKYGYIWFRYITQHLQPFTVQNSTFHFHYMHASWWNFLRGQNRKIDVKPTAAGEDGTWGSDAHTIKEPSTNGRGELKTAFCPISAMAVRIPRTEGVRTLKSIESVHAYHAWSNIKRRPACSLSSRSHCKQRNSLHASSSSDSITLSKRVGAVLETRPSTSLRAAWTSGWSAPSCVQSKNFRILARMERAQAGAAELQKGDSFMAEFLFGLDIYIYIYIYIEMRLFVSIYIFFLKKYTLTVNVYTGYTRRSDTSIFFFVCLK